MVTWAGISSGTSAIIYNDVAIENAINVEMRSVPVYDSTGRVVVYQRRTITVSGVVHSNTGTEDDLKVLHDRLLVHGKRLTVTRLGLPNLDISGSGPMYDLEFGPKPQVLTWAPVGGRNAAMVTFEIVVAVPACGSMFGPGVPYELTFDVDWDYDEHGTFTRNVRGTLKMTGTFQNGQPVYNVDQYRHLCYVMALPGTTRRQHYSESADQTTLTFIVTDTQIESRRPYPIGMTSASGEFSVQVMPGAGANTASLSLDLKSMYYWHPVMMWNVFATYFHAYTKKFGLRNTILTELSMSEQLWGLGASFSASWQFASTIEKILGASGFLVTQLTIDNEFAPLSWPAWYESVKYGPFAIHSYQGYGANGLQSVIDLCQYQSGGASNPSTPGTNVPGGGDSQRDQGNSATEEGSQEDQPDPRATWLDYDLTLTPMFNHSVSMTAPSDLAYLPDDSALTAGTTEAFTGRKAVDYSGAEIQSFISYNGGTIHKVILAGKIRRLNYEIPRPRLIEFGGKKAYEIEGWYSLATERVVDHGRRVYAMEFAVTYGLLGAPESPGFPQRIDVPPLDLVPDSNGNGSTTNP